MHSLSRESSPRVSSPVKKGVTLDSCSGDQQAQTDTPPAKAQPIDDTKPSSPSSPALKSSSDAAEASASKGDGDTPANELRCTVCPSHRGKVGYFYRQWVCVACKCFFYRHVRDQRNGVPISKQSDPERFAMCLRAGMDPSSVLIRSNAALSNAAQRAFPMRNAPVPGFSPQSMHGNAPSTPHASVAGLGPQGPPMFGFSAPTGRAMHLSNPSSLSTMQPHNMGLNRHASFMGSMGAFPPAGFSATSQTARMSPGWGLLGAQAMRQQMLGHQYAHPSPSTALLVAYQRAFLQQYQRQVAATAAATSPVAQPRSLARLSVETAPQSMLQVYSPGASPGSRCTSPNMSSDALKASGSRLTPKAKMNDTKANMLDLLASVSSGSGAPAARLASRKRSRSGDMGEVKSRSVRQRM